MHLKYQIINRASGTVLAIYLHCIEDLRPLILFLFFSSPISNRKPQTLTPPGGGSDGGSSGSGQSPTSTLPGSPPLISTTSTANKRPGFHEGPDGLSYKRQRIAHIAPAPKSQNNTVSIFYLS